MATIRVGEFGFAIKPRFTRGGSAVDVSAATTRSIIFEDPDGNEVTKSVSFFSDGTDGFLTYTVVSGLFDEPGTWHYWPVVSASSFQWVGRRGSIQVE